MPVRVAFFRGINVGGHGKLPMASLRAELERLGLNDVVTYIQSGNVAFRSGRIGLRALEEKISRMVEAEHGFRPVVMVRERAALDAVLEANPFPEGEATPNQLYAYLLDGRPARPDLESLAARATRGERFDLRAGVFWLHTPQGYGKSRVPERVERALGVAATARNWRTLTRTAELARGLS